MGGWTEGLLSPGSTCLEGYLSPPQVPRRTGNLRSLLRASSFTAMASTASRHCIFKMGQMPELVRRASSSKSRPGRRGPDRWRDFQRPTGFENVRGAQKFLGFAVHHYGPFYLWGDGVPPLLSHVDRRTASLQKRRMEQAEVSWTSGIVWLIKSQLSTFTESWSANPTESKVNFGVLDMRRVFRPTARRCSPGKSI